MCSILPIIQVKINWRFSLLIPTLAVVPLKYIIGKFLELSMFVTVVTALHCPASLSMLVLITLSHQCVVLSEG